MKTTVGLWIDHRKAIIFGAWDDQAPFHKENLECGSGYCSNSLAIECLLTHREPLDDPYREVKGLKIFERG